MTARVGLVLMMLASTVGCSGHRVGLPAGQGSFAGDLRVGVMEGGRTLVRTVALEEYVTAALLGELAPAEADSRLVARMFEVQAITSRTFAVGQRSRHRAEGFDFCSTTHCQIYEPDRLGRSRWAQAASEAVGRTRGIVLWYDARPAEAVFHADCGGHTAAAADVWGGSGRRYLIGAPDADGPHRAWQSTLALDAVRSALNGDERTRVGGRLREIDVTERDGSGRARQLTIRGERTVRVSGEELRRLLTRRFGGGAVRSTLFDIRQTPTSVTFSGRGHGHGVGLCQAGALARLRRGASPQGVLQHYFPGTSIGRL